MIKLENIIKNKNIGLFAKLEGQNPGGSIKDRVALYMIEQAEKNGELYNNKVIIEATSGNMGISLAMVGAYKGYEVHIVMSEGMSDERKTILRMFGANLILTDKKFGTEGAINKVKELVKRDHNRYWFANQFNNSVNTDAHYYGISQEILKEVSHIDYVVMGIGTSGTISGIAKRFKKDSPYTKIIGVMPQSGYEIQGIQNPQQDFSGSIYEKNLINNFINVTKEEAFEMARSVAKREGLFVGMSSGAILFAAKELSKSIRSGAIVTIVPDRGEKYLSTKLFSF